METTDMQAKSTKDRLEELKELHSGGYVTESEFKIARVNILKDGGIDVVTQLQHARRPYLQQAKEEEPKGCGCGCFLTTLLLTVILVLGVAFFAAPYWPERFGGARARAAQEWFAAKSTELIERLLGNSSDEVQTPDPVSSGDVLPVTEHASADSGPEAGQPDNVIESAAVPAPSAEPSDGRSDDTAPASIDIHISQPPSEAMNPAIVSSVIDGSDMPVVESSEPDASAAEEQATVSTEPVSADVSSENAMRGSVTARSARIRSAPDTSSNDNVVGWARAGDRFVVLEDGIGKDGAQWYNVVYENGDRRGWISGSLVKLER